MNYNLAKENFEKDLIFQDIVNWETIGNFYFGGVKPFDEDISDSREVEFMRAQYSEYDGNRCIQMTLRNTLNNQVDIEIDNKGPSLSKNEETKQLFTRFTLSKQSLKDSKPSYLKSQNLFTFIPSD